MKALKKIMNCLEFLIKKKFLNSAKTDIAQECQEVLEKSLLEESRLEEVPVEEYVVNYRRTTRWQTL